MARIAPLSPDGPNGMLPARCGLPAAVRCRPPGPGAALPRGGAYATAIPLRRTCFLSWKADLYQITDTATPSPDTLLRIITVQTGIAKLGLDLGSAMAQGLIILMTGLRWPPRGRFI
ncbi:hypothetical protein J2785_001961 [Burkholderia ambifaria]|nr:hypothetical protein [Burkholderia ambifaria]MDR6498816.1 hypothetical protein [Burkholderia ambifaria]